MSSGLAGWAGLAAYVTAYDLLARRRRCPSLSRCWWESPLPVTTALWALTTVHLFLRRTDASGRRPAAAPGARGCVRERV